MACANCGNPYVVELDKVEREQQARVGMQESLSALLIAYGCSCDCEHHSEEHDDDCERCLGCAVEALVFPLRRQALEGRLRAAVIAEVVAKLAHLRGSFAWTLDALDAFDQAIDAVKRLGAKP